MSDAWYRDALDPRDRAPATRTAAARPTPPERVVVEFVSANPTGPLTSAHARNAAYGDSLGADPRVRRPQRGARVLRERLRHPGAAFGESIQARARGEEPPEDGYHGDYVTDLAQRIEGAADADVDELAARGVELMLERAARVARALPRALSTASSPSARCTRRARSSGRSTSSPSTTGVYRARARCGCARRAFGDDKDRVLMRSNGELHLLRLGHRLPRGQARARGSTATSTSGAPTTTAT